MVVVVPQLLPLFPDSELIGTVTRPGRQPFEIYNDGEDGYGPRLAEKVRSLDEISNH